MSSVTMSEQGADLPNPPASQRRLFAKADGFYEIASTGVAQKLAGLLNVVEDTTPELGGTLDALNQDIVNAKTITFQAEFDNGASGAVPTIDWNVGQKQRITLTANATVSFTDPLGPANLLLKLIQDGSGNRDITWPGSVLWPGGNAPNLSNPGGSVDIVTFYFDGTNYYGVGSLNFQ